MLAVGTFFGALTTARAADVAVETWDGRHAEGRWVAVADGQLTVATAEDEKRTALNDVMRVAVPGRAPAAPMDDGNVTLYAADGAALIGRLTGGEGPKIGAECRWVGRVTLTLDALAGIRFGRPDKHDAQETAFAELLRSRPADRDVLIASEGDSAQAMRGVLRSISDESAAFRWDEQDLSVPVERIYALVLAKGVAESPAPAVTAVLADGTKLTGDLPSGDEERVSISSAAFGEVSVPLSQLVALEFRSDRVVFADELTPEAYRFEAYLNIEWPWRASRSVANAPIVLDGRTYAHGIGMHSQAALTFRTGGAYATFAATVGIDDAVRPRGSTVFRVLADDEEVYNSGPLSGADRARMISVPVRGADRVTLAVDFGPQADVSDHADWADARFVKPPARRVSP